MPISLRALTPPFHAAVELHTDALLPGAVLLVESAGGVRASGHVAAPAADAHRRAPWAPVCLVGDPRSIAAISLEPHLPAWAVVARAPWVASHEDPAALPERVLLAVRQRPAPTAAQLSAYIISRTDRSDLHLALAAALDSDPAASGHHRTTIWRHLSAFGELTARNWAAIARLTAILRRAGEFPGRTRERLAREFGVDPRTMDSWLEQYVGLPLAEAGARPGWEWIVESALRRGGYVSTAGGASERDDAGGAPRRRVSGEFTRL